MSDRQVIARISNDTNNKYALLIYGGYVNIWIWLLRTIENKYLVVLHNNNSAHVTDYQSQDFQDP